MPLEADEVLPTMKLFKDGQVLAVNSKKDFSSSLLLSLSLSGLWHRQHGLVTCGLAGDRLHGEV
jgi:hypothetical protein